MAAADAAPNPSLSEEKKGDSEIVTREELAVTVDGKRVKRIHRLRKVIKPVRVNAAILSRKNWQKFGDAALATPEQEANITYTSYEEVPLTLRLEKDHARHDQEDPWMTRLKGCFLFCLSFSFFHGIHALF